jgi:hypothetical protein
MKRLIRVPRPQPNGPETDTAESNGAEDVGALLAAVAEPITQHPDGWYWSGSEGKQQFGPFVTRAEAYAHLHGGDPDDIEPGESLQEAEAELGLTDWIDPDTGSLAEGMGVTHLER